MLDKDSSQDAVVFAINELKDSNQQSFGRLEKAICQGNKADALQDERITRLEERQSTLQRAFWIAVSALVSAEIGVFVAYLAGALG